MDQRIALHNIFKDVLLSDNVYFQPPESKKLDYPCIVYKLSNIQTRFANNSLYLHKKRYTVTLIDRNPDSLLTVSLLSIPLCTFDRFYVSNNLNHYVYSLYF